MRIIISSAICALLFASVLTNEAEKTIKFPLKRRTGAKQSHPPRKITYPEANIFYKTASDIEEFLSGFTREATSIEVDLANHVAYYSTYIYLGSSRQRFDVDIDTGSDILVIQDPTCTDC